MLRVVTVGLVLLAAAATVNVAVAWACAAFVEPGGARAATQPSGAVRWQVIAFERSGVSAVWSSRVRSPAIVLIRPDPSEPHPRDLLPSWAAGLSEPTAAFEALDVPGRERGTVETRHVIAAGWPMRALRAEVSRKVGLAPRPAAVETGGFLETGFEPWGASLPRVLPYEPIWSGVAGNTLVYTAALLIAWLAAGLLRQLVRVRRGRCPACGYPAGDSARCSECGKALRLGRPVA